MRMEVFARECPQRTLTSGEFSRIFVGIILELAEWTPVTPGLDQIPRGKSGRRMVQELSAVRLSPVDYVTIRSVSLRHAGHKERPMELEDEATWLRHRVLRAAGGPPIRSRGHWSYHAAV